MSSYTIISTELPLSDSQTLVQWFEDDEKTKPVQESINVGNIKSGFKYNDSMCLV